MVAPAIDMCRAPPHAQSLFHPGQGLSGDGCLAAGSAGHLPQVPLVLAVGALPFGDPPDVCWPEPASIDMAKTPPDAAPLVAEALVLPVAALPFGDPPDVCWPEPASIDMAKTPPDAAPLVAEVAEAEAAAVQGLGEATSLHVAQNQSPSGASFNGGLRQSMCHLQPAQARVQHHHFFYGRGGGRGVLNVKRNGNVNIKR